MAKVVLKYEKRRIVEDAIKSYIIRIDDRGNLWKYTCEMSDDKIAETVRPLVPNVNASHVKTVRMSMFGPLVKEPKLTVAGRLEKLEREHEDLAAWCAIRGYNRA